MSVGSKLVVVRANGSGERLVWESSSSGIGRITWAPDGTRLAFNHAGAIAVIDVDGTGLHYLTPRVHPDWYDQAPAWSPLGGRIAFQRSFVDTANSDIMVMHSDGTNVSHLTRDGADEWWKTGRLTRSASYSRGVTWTSGYGTCTRCAATAATSGA